MSSCCWAAVQEGCPCHTREGAEARARFWALRWVRGERSGLQLCHYCPREVAVPGAVVLERAGWPCSSPEGWWALTLVLLAIEGTVLH